MNPHRLKPLVLLLLVALLFTGCEDLSTSGASTHVPSDASVVPSSGGAPGETPPATGFAPLPLRGVNVWATGAPGSGNGQQYYELQQGPAGADGSAGDTHILVTDYATRRQAPLKNPDTGAPHTLTWADSTRCALLATPNHLLLGLRDRILVASPDGSRFEVLYQGGEQERLEDYLFTDGAFVYAVFWTYPALGSPEPASGVNGMKLLKIDIETGESTVLYQYGREDQVIENLFYPVRVVNAAGDKLCIRETLYTPDPWTFSREDLIAGGQLTPRSQQVQVLSTQTGEIEAVLPDVPPHSDALTLVSAEGVPFYLTLPQVSTDEDPVLYNLSTGTPAPPIPGVDFEALSFPGGPTPLFDGRLIGYGPQDEAESEASASLRALDPQTGETIDLKLSYSDTSSHPHPVLPLDESGDYFLVIYDLSLETQLVSGGAGGKAEDTLSIQHKALLLKEDYWNSVPNYLPIVYTP